MNWFTDSGRVAVLTLGFDDETEIAEIARTLIKIGASTWQLDATHLTCAGDQLCGVGYF
jgi:hypothetical protein